MFTRISWKYKILSKSKICHRWLNSNLQEISRTKIIGNNNGQILDDYDDDDDNDDDDDDDDELFLRNGWPTKDAYALFAAGTIVKDCHLCKSPKRR